jgi:hypothetical protein
MASFTINVNSYVNKKPTRLGTRSISIGWDEDILFVYNDFTILTVPTYVDPEGDAAHTIKILSLPTTGDLTFNNIACTVGQEIPFSAILSAGVNGLEYISDSLVTTSYLDTFNFDLSDTGSLTFSGLTTGKVNINVAAKINLPPTSGDNEETIDHGETLVFTSADFTTGTTPAYSDPEGDAALLLKITLLPTIGNLKLSGVNVSLNQIISFTDIVAGNLTYVGDNSVTTSISVEFDFVIQDTGSGQFGT